MLAGRLEYDNLIGSWNVIPHITWSSGCDRSFARPRRCLSRGQLRVHRRVTLSTRQRWEFDVAYSHFGGAGEYNLLNDRDFVAASVKVSF